MSFFIIKSDFVNQQRLERIINLDDTLWQKTLPSVLEHQKSFLRHRFDVAKAFSPIFLHSSSTDWLIDSRVIYSDILYYAIQNVPAGTLITNTDYWQEGDTRNPKIVKMTLQFLEYYLSLDLLNGVDIPPYLQIMYDENMMFLKEVQKGNYDIDLPLKEEIESGESQSGNRIMYITSPNIIYDKFVP